MLRKLLVAALVLLVLIWVAQFLRVLLFVTIVALAFVLLVRLVRWFDGRPRDAESRVIERELRRIRRYRDPLDRMERRLQAVETLTHRAENR